MKHVFIWFHIISFTPGIALIVLLWAIYLRRKQQQVKYIILADVFYTMTMLLDTMDLYIRKNILQDSAVQGRIFDYITVIATAILCYFTVCAIKIQVDEVVLRKTAAIFAGSGLLIIPAGVVLDILGLNQSCSALLFLSTIFYFGFIAVYISKEQRKLDLRSRKYFYSFILVFILAGIYMLLTKLFNNMPPFMYKVPVNPMLYFFVNAIGLIYANQAVAQIFSASAAPNNAQPITRDSYADCNITERELEIIKLVLEGQSNKDIADKLFISVNTVKNHIYSVYRKIGIKNRYELITYFDKNPINK
jgi:DNA-binding CsgD family transcriptional regulator